MDALEPNMKKGEQTFHCHEVEKADTSVYGYAYSSSLIGRDLRGMRDAKSAALIFDSTLLRRNAVGTLATLPDPPRHGGSNCIAYADGHAVAIRPGN